MNSRRLLVPVITFFQFRNKNNNFSSSKSAAFEFSATELSKVLSRFQMTSAEFNAVLESLRKTSKVGSKILANIEFAPIRFFRINTNIYLSRNNTKHVISELRVCGSQTFLEQRQGKAATSAKL